MSKKPMGRPKGTRGNAQPIKTVKRAKKQAYYSEADIKKDVERGWRHFWSNPKRKGMMPR